MLKNRKLIVILIIVFVIAIIPLTFYIYSKNTYSLQDIQNLLNSSKKSTNLHVRTEENVKDIITYTDTYIKDTVSYTIAHNEDGNVLSESFYDLQDSKLITIIHSDKLIAVTTEESQEIAIPTIDNNFFTISKSAKFKYIGKENVKGKQCLKVCLTDNSSKNYYYIDIEDNRIIRFEQYNTNNEKEYEITYTYFYDSVTDNDLVKFDTNNYLGYQYK